MRSVYSFGREPLQGPQVQGGGSSSDFEARQPIQGLPRGRVDSAGNDGSPK